MPVEQIAAGSNSMLRERALTHPADFIEPCLPRSANSPPTGPKWIHEIKHDGYRIMAQRADGRVRLLTRKERKRILAKLLSHPHEGIAFNKHHTGDGATIFKHTCALGCEGIVSKQLGSPYRSGRADCWVKVKNPTAPAANRLDEEEWRK
jgi:ATP-dependent DNA ligase